MPVVLRSVVFLMGLLLVNSVALAEKRFALLIGNQDYDASVGRLKNPHNDISIVGQALAAQGFELIPPIKYARRSTILGGVRELVRRLNGAGSGAIGFVYYSGHGAAEKDTNINYLIPVDAKEPGTTTFWDESVKLEDVLRLLDGARSAAKFIVFDACRNELQLPTKDTTKGLVPVAEQQGMFIAYASAPGRTASDRGDRSGPYAAALAAELAKPGLDHLNLFQNVKEAVLASTGGAQQPWESNGLGRRVFLTGQAKQPEGGQPPPTSPRLSEAAEAWAAAKDTTNIPVLEAFIARYKDTFYAELARAKVDDLKDQQVSVVAPPKAPAIATTRPFTTVTPSRPRAPGECIVVPQADWSGIGIGSSCIVPGSGKTEHFRDCPTCPDMVIVPEGSFTMGSPANEPERSSGEVQVRVAIPAPFAVSRFAVTFDEWDACLADDGCNGYKPSDQGWGRGKHPVINVNWDDAKAYAAWLSRKTGKTYRLLSEAEREYVTRAGTTTPFWWGNSITPKDANYNASGMPYGPEGVNGEYRRRTVAVDSFRPNPWGLYNVHGNVWEWVEDCWNDSNDRNPADGSARKAGDCGKRVERGGSWIDKPQLLRSAQRYGYPSENRTYELGFRLARTLSP